MQTTAFQAARHRSAHLMTDDIPKPATKPATGHRGVWPGEPTPTKPIPVAGPAGDKASPTQEPDGELFSESALSGGISLRYDTGEWVTKPVADEHKVGIF